MSLPDEVPAFGFPAYSVTQNGDIKRAGKVRSVNVKPSGYCEVALSVDGKKSHRSVHRLIWESFHGKIPEGMHINHLDGVKTNNALSNLACVSAAENHAHAKEHLVHRGAQVTTSKLTETKVLFIRQAHSEDPSLVRTLSEQFDVSVQTIYQIVKRQTWTHIP